MKLANDRISSLCTNLGVNGENGYEPSDICIANLDELAFSIYNEDATTKEVTQACYDLRVFERDFIPILQLEDGSDPETGKPIKYFRYALRTLTAITMPPSHMINDPARINEILLEFKRAVSRHPEVFLLCVTVCADFVEQEHVTDEVISMTELAFTFIRNIMIIESPPSVHEPLFHALADAEFFEVLTMIKFSYLLERADNFARVVAGILAGCFNPFLPLPETTQSNPEDPAPKAKPSSSILSNFLAQQMNQSKPTRHGHWGDMISTSKTRRTMPMPETKIQPGVGPVFEAPLPKGVKLRTRTLNIDQEKPSAVFTKEAEEKARLVIESNNFREMFERAMPEKFSVYDRELPALVQIQFTEMSRFFMEFSVKYHVAPIKARPLATNELTKYNLDMFNYWLEQSQVVERVTPLFALQKLAQLFGTFCDYLRTILETSLDPRDQNIANENLSDNANRIEDCLVALHCQKNFTKKPLSLFRDTIVALERLYVIYSVAEQKHILKKRERKRNEAADDSNDNKEYVVERYADFSSENIVLRLAKRKDVMVPFFILIDNYQRLQPSDIGAIVTMLTRFSEQQQGLAHLFRLHFMNIINKMMHNDAFTKSPIKEYQDLQDIFKIIIRKFIESARRNRFILISALIGPDEDQVYDEEKEMRKIDQQIDEELGIVPADQYRAAHEGSDSDDDDYAKLSEEWAKMIALKKAQEKSEAIQRKRQRNAERRKRAVQGEYHESDDQLSDDGNDDDLDDENSEDEKMTFEKLKKQADEKEVEESHTQIKPMENEDEGMEALSEDDLE